MADDNEFDYDVFLIALGRRIKQLRLARGLSLRDMVVKHDYHDSQWRRFERGGAGNLNSLHRIAVAFEITLSELLEGLGPAATKRVDRGKLKQVTLTKATGSKGKKLTT
jgi:transcriptional regulator with XRE-family HTH domain